MFQEEENEYEVEDIVGERVNDDGVTEYCVRWKGIGPEGDTYEPFDNLINCQYVLNKYYERKAKEQKKAGNNQIKPKEKNKKNHDHKNSSKKPLHTVTKKDSTSLHKMEKKKTTKTTPKKVSNSEFKTPPTIELIFTSDSDSGDIHSDFPSNPPPIEEPKKKIIKTPSFTINTAKDEKKQQTKGNKSQEKTKVNKDKPKNNKSEPESKKSQKKNEKTSPKKDSSKKETSKNDKKASKKKETSKSDESKSKSKKRIITKSDEDMENTTTLPFDLFLSDDKSDNNDDDEKKNISILYGEEHHLVLNPLPLTALKQKVYENGIDYVECQVPDRIETEKIPLSLIKILHPEMLVDLETNKIGNL